MLVDWQERIVQSQFKILLLRLVMMENWTPGCPQLLVVKVTLTVCLPEPLGVPANSYSVAALHS